MTETTRHILLATDLSARCDRALDRAVRLARDWNARLTVLHVLEPARDMAEAPRWQRPGDPQTLAAQALEADLPPDAGPVTIIVDRGDAAEITAGIAREQGCDLIITGLARNEALGRFRLGGTVERLARLSPAPVLVVRCRPRHDYDHVLVATDLGEGSAQVLRTSAALFPQADLTLFHAYRTPFAGLVANEPRLRADYAQGMATDLDKFLRDTLPPEQQARVRPLLVDGEPAQSLRDYALAEGVDLSVIGAPRHGPVLSFLLGSTAGSILEAAPCDMLLTGATPVTTDGA